jgi:hypothetical protein
MKWVDANHFGDAFANDQIREVFEDGITNYNPDNQEFFDEELAERFDLAVWLQHQPATIHDAYFNNAMKWVDVNHFGDAFANGNRTVLRLVELGDYSTEFFLLRRLVEAEEGRIESMRIVDDSTLEIDLGHILPSFSSLTMSLRRDLTLPYGYKTTGNLRSLVF